MLLNYLLGYRMLQKMTNLQEAVCLFEATGDLVDTMNLVAPEARSRVAGFFQLNNKDRNKIIHNGALLIHLKLVFLYFVFRIRSIVLEALFLSNLAFQKK